MDLGINKKVGIVTGGGKGIGKACVLSLAAEGVKVVVNDLDEAAGNRIVEELHAAGKTGIFIKGDVTCEEDVKSLFQKAGSVYGQVDILINNAGISPKLPFYDISGEDFDHVIKTNLKSNFLCSKEAFFHMKDLGWGRIVSLSSLAGLHGGIHSAAHYSASKAGIMGITKTLAKQMGPHNITVNCVVPGRIDTAMTRMLSEKQIKEINDKIPLRRLGTVEEAADVITFLASERASYITGACVEILGGYIG